jgi:hypothetical protein
VQIDIPSLDSLPAPRLDQSARPAGVLALTSVAEAALIEVHYGNTAHSIT